MVNLADKKQIKKAGQKEKDLRRQQMNDLRTVLSNASGRRFMWRVLERCQTFSSVFSKEPTTMAYMSGQQDLGHFIISEVTQADENLFIKLMKDNLKDKGEPDDN